MKKRGRPNTGSHGEKKKGFQTQNEKNKVKGRGWGGGT